MDLNLSAPRILDDIDRFTVNMRNAIQSGDRANVIRYCSLIMYCISDIVEYSLPDGVSITIK